MKHTTQHCGDYGDCGLWTMETNDKNSKDHLWEQPKKAPVLACHTLS